MRRARQKSSLLGCIGSTGDNREQTTRDSHQKLEIMSRMKIVDSNQSETNFDQSSIDFQSKSNLPKIQKPLIKEKTKG